MDDVLNDTVQALQARFGARVQEFRDQVTVSIAPQRLVDAARLLLEEFAFEMLVDVTAVDYWPQETPRFHTVYQFVSVSQNRHLQVRVPLNGNDPHVPSLEKVYPGVNWFEREIWDMFGIVFDGHSDMRRILMPYDWQGHPLRKDYPVGYEEVQFSFNFKEINLRKPYAKE
ncbi:MAG: NADH-quinone oxidoreductase subunit C [Chloroflexi bacterium]|jgi:NADH-quinone oxidoreductase subunit C|nr:NADH-quinone oxidoreductase subunit C [Anaerolineaceae bacterium]NMB91100.1 NADH-quinone oxidoreductase subunit C [Chloroflexota bacterium]